LLKVFIAARAQQRRDGIHDIQRMRGQR